MKYSVYYNNNVECNHVAEFDTLDEAKAYCVANTKDYDEIGEGDNCGAGWGEYPKADWTLERAIYDQCIDEHIN